MSRFITPVIYDSFCYFGESTNSKFECPGFIHLIDSKIHVFQKKIWESSEQNHCHLRTTEN
jgi:hypothetical protein